METLIEQLKASGFYDGEFPCNMRRGNAANDDSVMFSDDYTRVIRLSVYTLSGSISRRVSVTTIEEIEAFIARARRLIAEWETCEISFTAPSILS